ncbi:unnamed protein product [Prorocentrum cordatum]|uniref:Uncharacterized protein n=1 Tax=Prorocentrum cordatum TaxID=2364126 RepID=A0ABN9T1Y3_9DINO|nr:unnamed protein product [Polarella glacialis]
MLQLRTTPRECGLLWRAAASPHRRVRFWHAAGGAGSGPHSARWGGRSGREGRRRTMGRQENRRALRSLATARTRAGQASRVQLAGGSGASGERRRRRRRRQRGKQEEDLLLGGSRPDALGAARGEPPGGPPGGEGPAHTAPPRGVGRLPPPPTGGANSRENRPAARPALPTCPPGSQARLRDEERERCWCACGCIALFARLGGGGMVWLGVTASQGGQRRGGHTARGPRRSGGQLGPGTAGGRRRGWPCRARCWPPRCGPRGPRRWS